MSERAGRILLTCYVTGAPDEMPEQTEYPSVVEALKGAYRVGEGRGSWALLQIERDGQVLYDGDTLQKVVERIERLIYQDDFSLTDAAIRIASYDGHLF